MREPLPEDLRRSKFHTTRVTPAEHEELVQHAQAAHISVSQLVRARVLGLKQPKAAAPLINIQKYQQLARVEGNLNQLAHHLNSEALAGVPVDLRQLLGQVQDLVGEALREVKALRLDLIGASR